MATRVIQNSPRSTSRGVLRSLVSITDGMVSGTPEIATLLGADPDRERELQALTVRINGDDGIIAGSLFAGDPPESDAYSLDSWLSIGGGLATANQSAWQLVTRDTASIGQFWSRPPVRGLIVPKEWTVRQQVIPTGAPPTDRAVVVLLSWIDRPINSQSGAGLRTFSVE